MWCLADMNVGYVLDEAQLTRYFSQFGTVTDCYLPVSITVLGLLWAALLAQNLISM